MSRGVLVKGIYAGAMIASAYALLSSWQLFQIDQGLLLTTPLSLLPLCAFGALFAVSYAKHYPSYALLGLGLSILTAIMI